MKKPTFIIFITVFLIVALFLARVIVSNSLSTTGLILLKLESQLNSYKIENSNLKEKLLSLTSLSYISSESSQLGFVENKNSFTLTKPLPLAIKQWPFDVSSGPRLWGLRRWAQSKPRMYDMEISGNTTYTHRHILFNNSPAFLLASS